MFGQVKAANSIWSSYPLCSIALLLLLSSCAATIAKPHLYLLTSVPTASNAISTQSLPCAPVAVSVQLPAYLERDGLVLQLNDNELVAADNHLWAEPLIYGVERLLNVCLNPTRATVAGGLRAKQQVKVRVEQLHGNAQGVSRLQATWSEVTAANSAEQAARHFSGQAEQSKPGYDALVSAQRSLLLDLCQQMASGLSQCAQ